MIRKLRDLVHRRLSEYRTLDRIIWTNEFEELYKNNPELATDLVHDHRIDELKEILDDDGTLTVTKMREKARCYGIKNWSRLKRNELEEALYLEEHTL